MRVGLTYDLRENYLSKGYSAENVAEFDCIETIEAIEKVLLSRNFEVERIGCLDKLMHKLIAGERWDFVFNIAEGLYGIGREAQVPALLDAYRIPFTFSSTEILAVAMDKGLTNAVMRTYGVRTADFHVVRKMKDVERIKINYPLFVKPIAEGTSKGIDRNSKIDCIEVLRERCKYILDTFHQPALVEEFLSGREFTVGITGTGDEAKVIGVMEISMIGDADKQAYTYENKKQYEDRMVYTIVTEPSVARLALKAWQSLHCMGAGRVDIRMNHNNEPCFLEVNPMAGLNPEYSDLPILCRKIGYPYEKLINDIINDTLSRMNVTQQAN
ncbi:MAG: ATP-grasp domain-containing protein [Bacteroidales bacterium]|nr:ATP-grasp domain-containing protein [Bacteroidales bacterium]